jgi:nitric oxide reductase NorD protein
MSSKRLSDRASAAGDHPVSGGDMADPTRRAFPSPWRDAWLDSYERLAHAGYGAAVTTAFREASVSAVQLVGPQAIIEFAIPVSTVAIRVGPDAARAFCEAAPIAAARLAGATDFLRWAALVGRVAASAPEVVPFLLDRTRELLASLDVAGLETWVLAGLRAGSGDPGRRRAFFTGGDAGSARLLARASAEITFGDVERRMRAYFAALWGRRPSIRELANFDDVDRPRRATFTPHLVLLPPTFPGFRGRRAEEIFRATLAHIGAHLTFSPPRASAAGLRPLQIAVISLIEDARVEQLAIRALPGLARLWRPFHGPVPAGVSTVPALLARLARVLLDPTVQDADGWVQKGRELFFAARERWNDPTISRSIGDRLSHDLGQMRVRFDLRTYLVEPAYRDDHAGLWDFGAEDASEALRLDVALDGAKVREEERDGGRVRSEPTADRGASTDEPAEHDGAVVARLPEWDYEARCERAEWTTIVELPPVRTSSHYLDEVKERHPGVATRIDRLVKAARISRLERLNRRVEGELLDLDAAIEAVADLRNGRTPDTRVYRTLVRRRRDLAVSLLLDVSRSTGDPVADGRRTVLDLERDAVALLAQAMSTMGDRLEILAFDSAGRESVHIRRLKRFDEPLGPSVAAALAGTAPGLSTRVGAVLRFAGLDLARERTWRRLALLVTDGEPADIDCPDPRYLVEDARSAVAGLRRQGIDVFCLALGARDPATLRRMFGPRGFAISPRIETVPERLPALYFALSR